MCELLSVSISEKVTIPVTASTEDQGGLVQACKHLGLLVRIDIFDNINQIAFVAKL